MKKAIFLTFIAVLVALSSPAFAADVTPVKPAVNPINQTLYYINNDVYNNHAAPKLLVYTFPWNKNAPAQATIDLGAGNKSHGLAVSGDGTKLYLTIDSPYPSTGDKVLVYNLDLNNKGLPVGSPTTMGNVTWSQYAEPAGVALGGNSRLFVTDKMTGIIKVFDTNSNLWLKNITDLQGSSNLYDIVATPAVSGILGTNCKLYVSRKSDPGAIYVFTYAQPAFLTTETATLTKTINTGVTFPTYLKVAGDRLFVAVNGYDGADILVYETATDSLLGKVKSGVTGNFGWTAFDVSADGSMLVFKKAQNSAETSNKLYYLATAPVTGGADFTANSLDLDLFFNPDGISPIKSDGLVLAQNLFTIALTHSFSGALQVLKANGSSIVNMPPSVVPATMKQFKTDGITEIIAGGTTEQDHIIVKFKVTDPNNNNVTPIVLYRPVPSGWNDPYTSVEGNIIPSGSVATITIPATGKPGFTSGSYEWMADARDSLGMLGGQVEFNANGGVADFIVSLPPVITKVYPNKAPKDTQQTVRIRGTNFDTKATVKLAQGGQTVPGTVLSGNTNTEIVATFNLAGAAVGKYDVVVTNPGNISGTAVNSFEVINPGDDKVPPSTEGMSFNATDGGTTQVVLTWTNPSDPDLRKIIIVRNKATGWPAIDQNGTVTKGDLIPIVSDDLPVPGASGTKNDTNIAIDNVYYYALFAQDTSGNWNTTVLPKTNADTGITGITSKIIVLQPNGGEILPPNSKYDIIWDRSPDSHFKEFFKIEFSQDGGTNWKSVIDSIAGNIYPSWDVPNINTTQARIRVSLANDPKIFDISDNDFTIGQAGTAPTVTAIAPVSGKQGNTVNATITGTNFVTGAAVKLTKTGPDILPTGTVTVDSATQITANFAIPATAQIGPWTVIVTNPDTQTGSLVDGFTVTGSGSNPVVNIVITREGDTPGSDIKITWDTNPAGLGVDIYRLTCNTDANGNYTSYFTTEAATWGVPIETNNLTKSYKMPSSVGIGTAQYYKLVQTGIPLTNNDLTTAVVGKFDQKINTSTEESKYTLVSVPLETSDYTLDAIFGTQLTEGAQFNADQIKYYNGTAYDTIYLDSVTHTWQPIGSSSLFTVDLTKGYFIKIFQGHTSRNFITFVGKVRYTATIGITFTKTQDNGGYTPFGNPYPISVTFDNADMSGATEGAQFNADQIKSWNGSSYDTIYRDSVTHTWQPIGSSVMFDFVPGHGYFYKKANDVLPMTWDYNPWQ